MQAPVHTNHARRQPLSVPQHLLLPPPPEARQPDNSYLSRILRSENPLDFYLRLCEGINKGICGLRRIPYRRLSLESQQVLVLLLMFTLITCLSTTHVSLCLV